MKPTIASFYAALLAVLISYIITKDVMLIKTLLIVIVSVGVGRFVWLDEVIFNERTRN